MSPIQTFECSNVPVMYFISLFFFFFFTPQIQDDQASQLELDSQLAEMNTGTSRINNQPLSEQADHYVKETQAEIQDMLHGGGQGDTSTVGGGGTLTKADKRDLRRKKELGVKLKTLTAHIESNQVQLLKLLLVLR